MNTNAPRTRKQLREALESAQRTSARHESELKRRHDLLVEAGYRAEAAYSGFGTPYTRWHQPERITRERVSEAVKTAEAATRRETLEKVLQALEIKGYINGWAGLLNSRAPLAAEHDTDRFWEDLSTTLEYREQEKHAATQKRIAEKVAGLTKPKSEYAAVITNTSDIANLSGQLIANAIPADEARVNAGVATPKKKPAAKKTGDKK